MKTVTGKKTTKIAKLSTKLAIFIICAIGPQFLFKYASKRLRPLIIEIKLFDGQSKVEDD